MSDASSTNDTNDAGGVNNALPVWRQALNDSSHPLYAAAWTIFGAEMNLDAADKRLADHKEQVIPFLMDILDTPELYDETALGSGDAPINAVQLLGRWQVMQAVPRLLKIMEEEDWETVVHDRAIVALEDMGPQVIDTILQAAGQTTDEDRHRTFASILSHAGKGDPRAFEYVKTVFDQQKDETDIAFVAEDLLVCDSEAGIALLEDRLKHRKYGKNLRKRLEKYLDDARKGVFDTL
jgi:hypothetical protein